MTLIVHHLQRSQSEPIVWLCEELGLQYELKIYRRKQKREGLGAPPELKALHPCGTAPIIQDASITLAETGAIIEYLLARYGNDRLRVQPDAPNFTSCIFWYHWAIVSLQLVTKLPISLRKAGVQWSSPQMQEGIDSIASALHLMDARLKKAPFLAGDEITAADIYAVFSVTTLRLFVPFALTGYDGLLGWLKRASKRPAYKAMVEKAETGEEGRVSDAVCGSSSSHNHLLSGVIWRSLCCDKVLSETSDLVLYEL